MPKISLSPNSADFPSSNFPELKKDAQGRKVLAFDGGTNESCWWGFSCPSYSGTPEVIISYYVANDNVTGDSDWDVQIEAVSDGDSLDMEAAESWDTANSTDGTSVPGTAGYPDQITVTLTNRDSMAEDDQVRLRLTRDAASDTNTADIHVTMVHLKYT